MISASAVCACSSWIWPLSLCSLRLMAWTCISIQIAAYELWAHGSIVSASTEYVLQFEPVLLA